MRISSGVGYAVFIAVTLQNVGGGGLLSVRDGGSGREGEGIYGSGAGKGSVSRREGVGGVGGGSVGDGVGVHS